LNALQTDVRYALRSLARAPAFVLVAVLTIAAGTGAITAVFSVLYGALLRPLPYDRAEELVVMQTSRRDEVYPALSKPDLEDVRRESHELVDVATWRPWPLTVTPPGGEPTRSLGASVDSRYFSLLGMAPALGRRFTRGDDQPGHEPVVMLSHSFWLSYFGGDPGAVGRTIDLDGSPYTVVGVAPSDFSDPLAARHALAAPPLWRASPQEFENTNRTWRSFWGLGRMSPGSTAGTVRAELASISSGLEETRPDSNAGVRLGAVPLREHLVGSSRRTIVVLAMAVLLVLVVACANVANLLLTRGLARSAECAVRRALGADRLRVARPLVVENAILCGAGLAGGLGLAWGLSRLFDPWTRGLATMVDIRMDAPVLLGSATLCFLAYMSFGLLAVWPAVGPERPVRSGARAVGAPGGRLRGALVVVETALAVALLISAGLLLRSLQEMDAVDLGVRVDGAVVATITPSSTRHAGPTALHQVVAETLAAVAATPGVREAGVVSDLPLTGAVNSGWITRVDRPLPPGEAPPSALYRTVAGPYFEAAGIPLRAGRAFDRRDRGESGPVVVLNEAAVASLFPQGDALGRAVQIMGTEREVVGIVGDVREAGPDAEAPMAAYVPFAQETQEWAIRTSTLFVRVDGDDPWDVAADVRRAIRRVDDATAINDVRTMADIAALATRPARFRATLLGAFASMALVLAVFGLGSVVAYQATRRRRELGVRMALGATRGQVVDLVVRRGVGLAAVGAMLGVALSMLLGRSLEHLLFGVRATDPTVMLLVPSAFVAASALAALVPASRLSRFEPAVALRDE